VSRSLQELLREALVHLEIARSYAQQSELDQLAVDAICMRLSAGIEVLSRLDASDRARIFGDDWPLMWGMRNRIAHGYLLVDPTLVRQTVETDLPVIVRGVGDELDR